MQPFFQKTSNSLEFIKYLSILSMIIDHTGLLLCDDNFYMRAVGRFALIGFSFIIAYNYRYHTRSKKKYKSRLLKWAFISQLPYSFAFGLHAGVNILFLLVMSLYAIDIIENISRETNIIRSTLKLSSIFFLSIFTGYAIFGVFVIVFFYYAFVNKRVIPFLLFATAMLNFSIFYAFVGLASVCLIYYTKISFSIKRIKGYFFYLFYPTHLIIITLIKQIFL